VQTRRRSRRHQGMRHVLGASAVMTGRHFIVAACVAALVAAPVWGATVLTFDVVSHTEPAKGAKEVKGPSLPADTHYTMSVTLAGDTLQLDQPDAQLRYDFKNFRIEALDKARKTYRENSLYTVVGFAVMEFANRMMLAKVLAAGKIKNNPMAPA